MLRRSSSRLWAVSLRASLGCTSEGAHHLLLLLLLLLKHVLLPLQKYDLMLEFMVNHISPGSAEFKDFKEHGAKSKFADLFVSWERIWGKRKCHGSASRRRGARADAAPCMSSMCGPVSRPMAAQIPCVQT